MSAEWYIRIACFGMGFTACGLIWTLRALVNAIIEGTRE